MSLATLLVHDVTVVHAGTSTDRYGNETKDWATGTRTDVKAWVSRTTTTENRDNREAQVSEWLVYLPAGTVVTGGDRIEWQDATFEVDGLPYEAWSPRGPHHIEAPLRTVEG